MEDKTLSYSETLETFLDEQFGEDLDILESFLNTFTAKHTIYSQRIREAMENEDITHAGEICHEIKGIVSNLGPSQCLEQVKTTEEAIKTGTYQNDWDQELFEKNLKELLESVTQYLSDKGVQVA